MGAWTNLAAIHVNMSHGNTNNWATQKQIGSIAGRLSKHIKVLLSDQCLSMGKEGIRNLRIQFLNDALGDGGCWEGNGPILTTSQLSFGAANAVLDWLESGSAAEDLTDWLAEQDLPYAEEMFEQAE